jgi:hypothetical protein
MGTKRVGWARIKSLINESTNGMRFQNQNVETVTADKTLVADDSGKTFLINQNGIDVTLPTPTAGMNFKFIMAQDYATAVCTVTAAGSGYFMAGNVTPVVDGTGTGTQHANGSSHEVATFAAASLAGDWLSCVSNGTLWFVQGACSGAAAIAFSD